MTKDFFKAVEDRRSIYGISSDTAVSDERIQEIVEFAVKHAPTSFNSQSSRAVLLLGNEHKAFWEITKETLRKVSSKDFGPTEEKMNAFAAGRGTVLFFEDEAVVKGLQEQFPSYADKFPDYSLQSSGMFQYIVWAGFEVEGIGATLQHYQPLVDDEVKAKWNIPDSWKLIAQMPFGKPVAPAGEKGFEPVEERVKVFNS